MNNKSTVNLESILKKSGLKDYDKYAKEELIKEPTITEFFNDYIANNNLILSDIVNRSGISRTYAYHIIDGSKKPSRDYVLALCLAAHMDYDTTQRALKIANVGILYPKVGRDVVIGMCINDGVFDLVDINSILDNRGFDIILK